LRPDGHVVLQAASGAEGLSILEAEEVAVIVSDHMMPGMSGTEFLGKSVEIRPEAVRIMLTASLEQGVVREAINVGRVTRFLNKPWEPDILRSDVREGVRRFELEREVEALNELTRRQRDELRGLNADLEQRVRERTAALHVANQGVLDALVLGLDSREQAEAGHCRRVALQCLYLALAVGFPIDRLEDLYRGALLHDIGKLGTPDAVMMKAGKLDERERAVIEKHVIAGGEIMRQVVQLESAAAIPLYHHERWDGAGYCAGLAGEAIPLEARIFSLVDVYDALLSKRPGARAMTHEQACFIIAKGTGSFFDPAIAKVFLELPGRHWADLAELSLEPRPFHELVEICFEIKARGAAELTS